MDFSKVLFLVSFLSFQSIGAPAWKRVVLHSEQTVPVSIYDLSIACWPHINGSSIGLLSKTLDTYFQKNLSFRYEHLEHPNHPTILHYRGADCGAARDKLRAIQIGLVSEYLTKVSITLTEEYFESFGLSIRNLTQNIGVRVGDMKFEHYTVPLTLERKKLHP